MSGLFAVIVKLFFVCSFNVQPATSNDGEQSPCTVCRDGSSIPSNFAKVSIVIPGYEFVRNCSILQSTLSTLDSKNSICSSIQSFGTICGCPIAENACTLCPDGSSVPEKHYTTSLASYKDPFFPQGITPNCRLLEAYLHSTTIENETCLEGLQFAANCGCNGTKDSSKPTSPPKPATNTSDHPEKITETTTTASELCTFCRDGGEFAFPEKNVTPFLVRNSGLLTEAFPDFPDPKSLGTLTCQNLADFLDSAFPLDKDTEECYVIQRTLGGICGCQRLSRYCNFCPNDEYIPQADKIMTYTAQPYKIDGIRVPVLTCSEVKLSLTQVDDIDENLCFLVNHEQHTCGCNGGERYYLGADSKAKKAVLAWIPRLTGLLSLMGSIWIIIHILWKSNNRNLMFPQIMLGLSTFDCFSSMAWIFSSAPVPKYGLGGEPIGVYGAIGNKATCKTQGFFVQLGLIGSISFNVVLSIYYVLVIVKSYREFQFQRLRRWFLAIPIILAFTYAFTGLPHYSYIITSCHVAPYPAHPTHALTLGFLLLPLGVAWCICSFNMGWIYWSVRKQSIAAQKWRFPTRGTATRTIENTLATGESTSHNDLQRGNDNRHTISSLCLSCLSKLRWFRHDNVEDSGPDTGAQENGRVSTGTQGNGGASMDRAVAWQAAFYLCSFLLTWPFYFISFLDMTIESYGFWMTVVIFTPLQGFFNWIVYMRPRWGQKINKRKQRRQLKYTRNGLNDVRPTPPSSNGKSSVPSSRNVPVEDEKADMTRFENIDSVEPTSHDDGGDFGYDDDEMVNCITTGIEPVIQQVIFENSGDFSRRLENDTVDMTCVGNIDSVNGQANHDNDEEEAVNHVTNRIEPANQQAIAENSGDSFSEHCIISSSSTYLPVQNEKEKITRSENIDFVGCAMIHHDDEETFNHITTGIESIDQQVILERSGDSSSGHCSIPSTSPDMPV